MRGASLFLFIHRLYNIDTMVRCIGLFLFASLFFPGLVFAQNISQVVADKRAQLERDLAALEQEIDVQQQLLTSKKAERQSLERDVSILDASIKKAKLSIKAQDLAIEKLSDTIDDKQDKIVGLDAKLNREKQSLAQLIRKTNQINDISVAEIVLGKQSLSNVFLDLDTFSTIKMNLQASFEVIAGTRTATEAEKNALEDKKADKVELRRLQVVEQQRIESQEKEKQQILKATKGVEASYQQLLKSKQKSAAEIRAALFSLRDSAAIPFGKALEYATIASQATDVRAALILGILQQETELGANLGTGTMENDMHPTRDVPVYLAITSFLGLNPNTMPVSRKAGLSAWGGAMGPGQFIPSTWACYGGFVNTSTNGCAKNPDGSWKGPWEYREEKDRIRRMLGNSRPSNPWEAKDAFMATAVLMMDNGAAAGTFAAERKAAVRYFAGWKNGDNQTYIRGYGDPVMEHTKYFQSQIDILGR